jgi:hypothetical protein
MFDWITNSDRTIVIDLSLSVALLVSILLLRAIVVRLLKNQNLTLEARRKWAIGLRNSLAIVFIIGLFFIWAQQLNTLAVSLFAIAVAIVLATKEMILCISGTVLRIRTNAYTLGDLIQIGNLRGNVLDQTLLATTLVEVGPGQMSQQYTGRVVFFPNSLLLSTPVINETYTKDYIVHIINIPLTVEDNWEAAEKALLEASQTECGPFIKEAQWHMERLERKNWVDTPSVQPRVTVCLPEPGCINLLLRIPCPARHTSRVEQAILRRFLSDYKPVGINGHPAGNGKPASKIERSPHL